MLPIFSGESVRVNSLPIKPFIPPDYKLLFEKWQPVYRDFRFNEAFVFLDYEQTGSVNRLCLTEKQDSPRSIQCVRLYEDECFFKITISEIGVFLSFTSWTTVCGNKIYKCH